MAGCSVYFSHGPKAACFFLSWAKGGSRYMGWKAHTHTHTHSSQPARWGSWVAATTFSRRRATPPLDFPGAKDDVAALLTGKMREFMDRVGGNPPDPWFHRKSEKLVLAMLMVRTIFCGIHCQ